MNIAAECRRFRALTLYFFASSCWYAWFIALSSLFATIKACVAFGDVTFRSVTFALARKSIISFSSWERGLLITLLTYGSIPYGVSSIRGSTIGTKIPWGSTEQKMWPNRSLKFSVSFLFCWLKLCNLVMLFELITTMVVISISVPMAKLQQNDHILCRRAVPFLSASFASFSLFSFLLLSFPLLLQL